MVQQFIDRKTELSFLNDRFESDNPEFIILYGRRRVGKTELIKQFIQNRDSIYFLADRRIEKENIKELQKNMAEALNDSLFEKVFFENYIDLFREFSNKLENKRLIIVIDEFSYLMEGNKAIDSIFQKIWDENLSQTKIYLILCGSSISMMESLMGYKNPLYGRRTGQWDVDLLKFNDAREFLPHYSIDDQIRAYSILDGIPAYLKQFDDKIDLETNIKNKIVDKGSFLHIEPEFLLREELREPRNYFLILKAISFGNTTFGHIVNYTGLDKTLISKYLDTLSVLHIIKKIYPITLRKERARDTRFEFCDNFLDFWFNFIYPYKEDIEEGNKEWFENILKKRLNTFIGKKYESICIDFLIGLHKNGKILPLSIRKLGRWWHKDKEIDIIALDPDSKEILFVECKWKDLSLKQAEAILFDLKAKSKFVDWNRNGRKEYFGIVAKNIESKTALLKKGFVVFDLRDF